MFEPLVLEACKLFSELCFMLMSTSPSPSMIKTAINSKHYVKKSRLGINSIANKRTINLKHSIVQNSHLRDFQGLKIKRVQSNLLFLYGKTVRQKFITWHNSQLKNNYRRSHPYLHRKGLDYVWVQLIRQRKPYLYGYMESIDGRSIQIQARTVKWGWQKCCRDHKIWLIGERNHCWASSTKHFQDLLYVSESS